MAFNGDFLKKKKKRELLEQPPTNFEKYAKHLFLKVELQVPPFTKGAKHGNDKHVLPLKAESQ